MTPADTVSGSGVVVPANTGNVVAATVSLPANLVHPPCDVENGTADLTSLQCMGLSSQALTYYSCPSGSSADYQETLTLITDGICPGEDRLLQCEMEGREVSSNILIERESLFEPMFLRTRDNISVSHTCKYFAL